MVIVFPEDTESVINGIRDAIGRDVTFITVTTSGCPTCGLDPTTGHSLDSFCPVCSGLYWIPIPTNTDVKAHVTWANADILQWYPGGQQFDGDVRIQIEYTATNLALADDAVEVIVDNKVTEIKSKILRGVQNINRIILDLIEKENTNE